MNRHSRSRRMVSLVMSHDKHLLDLPKYETTKGVTKADLEIAVEKFKASNVEDNNVASGVDDNYNISISSQKIDEKENSDFLASSGTEYIPETCSSSESDVEDEIPIMKSLEYSIGRETKVKETTSSNKNYHRNDEHFRSPIADSSTGDRVIVNFGKCLEVSTLFERLVIFIHNNFGLLHIFTFSLLTFINYEVLSLSIDFPLIFSIYSLTVLNLFANSR